MAKLHINIGDTANDRTGDPLRTAFEKVNSNFDELYARTGDDIQIPALAGNNGKVLTTNGTTLSWATAYNDRLVNGPLSVVFNAQGEFVFPAGGKHYDLGAGEGILSHNIEVNSNAWAFGFNGTLTLPSGSLIEEELVTTSGGGTTSFTIATDFQSQIDVNGTNIGVANTVENQQIVAGWTITFADGVTTRVANSSTGGSGPSGEYLINFDTPVNLLTGFPITVSGPSGGTTETLNLKLTPATGVSWSFDENGNLTLPTGGYIYGLNIIGSEGTNIQLDQTTGNVYINSFNNGSSSSNEWTFANNGDLAVPAGTSTTSGAIQQRTTRTVTQGNTIVEAGTSGIIFSSEAWQTGFKLIIIVETRLDNNTDDVDHTQMCEAMIASNYNSDTEPTMSVYGLTYTSPTPLATFSVQKTGYTGSGSGTIEVVATNVQAQYNLAVSVHAVQFGSFYD